MADGVTSGVLSLGPKAIVSHEAAAQARIDGSTGQGRLHRCRRPTSERDDSARAHDHAIDAARSRKGGRLSLHHGVADDRRPVARYLGNCARQRDRLRCAMGVVPAFFAAVLSRSAARIPGVRRLDESSSTAAITVCSSDDPPVDRARSSYRGRVPGGHRPVANVPRVDFEFGSASVVESVNEATRPPSIGVRHASQALQSMVRVLESRPRTCRQRAT